MDLDTLFKELHSLGGKVELQYMWELAEIPDAVTDGEIEELEGLEQQEREFVQDLGEILEESTDTRELHSKTASKLGQYLGEDVEKSREFKEFITKKYLQVYEQLDVQEYQKVLGQIENIDDSEADEFFNRLETQLQQSTPQALDSDYEGIRGLTETAIQSSRTTDEFTETVRGFYKSFEYEGNGMPEKMEEFIEKLYSRALPLEPEYLD